MIDTRTLADAVIDYYHADRLDLLKVHSFRGSYQEITELLRLGADLTPTGEVDLMHLLCYAPPGMGDVVENLRAAWWAKDIKARNAMPPLPQPPPIKFGRSGTMG